MSSVDLFLFAANMAVLAAVVLLVVSRMRPLRVQVVIADNGTAQMVDAIVEALYDIRREIKALAWLFAMYAGVTPRRTGVVQ